jgi:hypothetical protein
MPFFLSITRLRIRSLRFMPGFALQAIRSSRQCKRAPGFVGGSLLADYKRAFWTTTLWLDQEAMRAYMASGVHRIVMPKLIHWCDEASVVHWVQETTDLPSWSDANTRMRTQGRASKVLHPSSNHADLSFAVPRMSGGVAITPVKPAEF